MIMNVGWITYWTVSTYESFESHDSVLCQISPQNYVLWRTDCVGGLFVNWINILKLKTFNNAIYFLLSHRHSQKGSGPSVQACPINTQSHKLAKRNPLPKQADLVHFLFSNMSRRAHSVKSVSTSLGLYSQVSKGRCCVAGFNSDSSPAPSRMNPLTHVTPQSWLSMGGSYVQRKFWWKNWAV